MSHFFWLLHKKRRSHGAPLNAPAAFALALLVTACQGAGLSDVHGLDQNAATLMRVADETRAGGDPATAIDLYRRLHEMRPKDAEPMARLGATLAQVRAYREAAQAYRVALSLAPDDVDLHRSLGLVLLSLDQPEAALAEAQAALAKHSDDARLYNVLGVAHDLIGRHDLAQQDYRNGLRIAPQNAGLRNNYGMSLALSDDYPAAAATLGELANDPTAPSRYRLNLALIYGLAGDDKKAAAIARVALDEAAVRNNLAYYALLRAMDDKTRAAAIMGAQMHGAPPAEPPPIAANVPAEQPVRAPVTVVEATSLAAPAVSPPQTEPKPKTASPVKTASLPTSRHADRTPHVAPAPVTAADPEPAPVAIAAPAEVPPAEVMPPIEQAAVAEATAPIEPSAGEATPPTGSIKEPMKLAPGPAETHEADRREPVPPAVPSASPAAEEESAVPAAVEPASPEAAASPAPIPDVTVKGAKATSSTVLIDEFVVQLGSFASEVNARKLADRLNDKGYGVSVARHHDRDGREWFTVRASGYASADEATTAARRLREAEQVPAVVVRPHASAPPQPSSARDG